MKTRNCLFVLSFSILLLPNCSFFFKTINLPHYDQITYKNLTDTKPIVLNLYDSFVNDLADSAKINEVRVKLDQIFEYEKGKGINNQDIVDQIARIKEMFERHVKNRLSDGKWNETSLNNYKDNIGQAFDEAIDTEVAKNKKK